MTWTLGDIRVLFAEYPHGPELLLNAITQSESENNHD